MTCRIYVACLASYNAGALHGVWIDLDGKDSDDVQVEISEMLIASPYPNVTTTCPDCSGDGEVRDGAKDFSEPCERCLTTGKVPAAEEWAIHDYEGYEGLTPDDIDDAILHASMIEEHGSAWVAYVNLVGAHYATEDNFDEAFLGEHSSPEDYAQEMIEEQGTDLGPLANYIDWERYARDLRHNGFHFVDNGSGGIYVFRSL